MFFPEPGHPWLAKLLKTIESLPPSNFTAPDVSGIRLLNLYPAPEIGMEHRVAPPGSRRAPVTEPLAIHAWRTAGGWQK